MVKNLTISVSDKVYEYIEKNRKKNRSEFAEELIRSGIIEHQKEQIQKEADKDEKREY